MAGDSDRMRAIHDELNGILEARITELLGQIKAVQEVTLQVVTAEQDIRRHQQMRHQLESELGPLQAETTESQARVDAMRDTVTRMRQLRDELQSHLSGLSVEMKGLSGGK